MDAATITSRAYFIKQALIKNILLNSLRELMMRQMSSSISELNDSRCHIYTKIRNYSRNIDLLQLLLSTETQKVRQIKLYETRV